MTTARNKGKIERILKYTTIDENIKKDIKILLEIIQEESISKKIFNRLKVSRDKLTKKNNYQAKELIRLTKCLKTIREAWK